MKLGVGATLVIATLSSGAVALGQQSSSSLQVLQDQTPYNWLQVPPPATPSGNVPVKGVVAFGGLLTNTTPWRPPVAGSMTVWRLSVGAPFLKRPTTFMFGQIISVPDVDLDGASLASLNPPVAPTNYWRAEPVLRANDTTETLGFYWSKHRKGVYASQAGPIRITWQSAVGESTKPASGEPEVDYHYDGSKYYRRKSFDYVVSPTPVKKPRKLYWTESTKGYAYGKLIAVPKSLVGDIVFAYNNLVPRTNEVDVFYGNREDQPFKEVQTVWYDPVAGLIHAYNREGTIVMEILGDAKADGTRESLGYEILNIIKHPEPITTTTWLGELLVAPPAPDMTEAELKELIPELVNLQSGSKFAYQHSEAGTGRSEVLRVT
ncbi:MAG: hypothetical protein AB9869_00260 [Verrucomicrobiia bacterium]